MRSSVAEKKAGEFLALADIRLNGDRPQDLRVLHPDFYQRIVAEGSLGLGESYVDGWWECERLDRFFHQILAAKLDQAAAQSPTAILMSLKRRFFNLQTEAGSLQVGQRHYDVGNDLFMGMLDPSMTYTCGYWKDARDLEDAQEAKLDLVCRKLGLKPGQRVLDIGCGWGSFIKFAAERYGIQAVGITISKEQQALAKVACLGLPIDVRLQDYREVDESFDHIVSLGMFEHVGLKNHREYFEVAHRCLKEKGLFLLHTIASADTDNQPDPWIERYIFPNSMLPNAKNIVEASADLFRAEDWHNLGPDYDPTLMAWFSNFERAWPQLRSQYSQRFYRTWKYYLLSCAGTFRAGRNQVWQILYSRSGDTPPARVTRA
jgi:cyclopropane-fatty-acyl-phospholipid synthase